MTKKPFHSGRFIIISRLVFIKILNYYFFFAAGFFWVTFLLEVF
ncbi:hypothetical protein LCGC14_1089790 [marine sediment metagenome]|uniref:Uncharacterized protein n=1 Tax=marine sediment metagenome TaxID=412755 RepID=A0A0F9QIP1_9ZZZZ